MAHILVPHPPYEFNADGSLSNSTLSNNDTKLIKKKYTGQVEFINSEISKIIADINKNSAGEAVILLISDEGPYPVEMNQTVFSPVTGSQADDIVYDKSMLSWSDDELKMKYGILQALRIPGASSDDMSHVSPVNAFRIVLNTYFGYEFPYLQNCHLALQDGRENLYKYKDITDRISGSADDSECQQYE
jgi:hypothetical protein